MSDLLSSGLGSTFEFEAEWDQAMPMFQPIGGMDRIAYALAAAVRGPIRYQSQVRTITTRSDRVDVEYTDAEGVAHQTSADYCICTIPPMVLSKIDANFPTQVVASIASIQPFVRSCSAASRTPTSTSRPSGTPRTASTEIAGSSSATTCSVTRRTGLPR